MAADATRSSDLRRFVIRNFSPCMLVLTTESAEAMCRANGLSCSELLSPFAESNRGFVVHTPSSSHAVDTFRLRFVPSHELEPVPMQRANQVLAQTLSDAAQEEVKYSALETAVIVSRHDADVFIRRTGDTPLTPWTSKFREQLHRTLQAQPHEMFDHPIGLLLVASTDDAHPMACFEDLESVHHLPSPFQTNQFHTTIPKYYLLLHNGCKPQDTRHLLVEMQNRFSATKCSVLEINSLPPESPNLEAEDRWAAYVHRPLFSPPTPRIKRGSLLSPEDIERIRKFVDKFVEIYALPLLQQRMADLNTHIASVKKGLKNALKSWWRKPRDAGAAASVAVGSTSAREVQLLYPASTIEAQIRLLADYLFMVQDYDGALSAYRLVKDDFKADKALYHYAGTIEMAAMCQMLHTGPSREIDTLLEHACNWYTRATFDTTTGNMGTFDTTALWAGRPSENAAGIRLCTRLAFLFADVLSCGPEDKTLLAASRLLAAAAQEEPMCAAILTEQAAVYYLRTKPSLPRKFAFYMYHAGQLFQSCGQTWHAVRCFKAAVRAYSSTQWTSIEDHILITLARQLTALADAEGAVTHLAKLLSDGGRRLSADTQRTVLSEFQGAFAVWAHSRAPAAGAPETAARTELANLSLPHIDEATVDVLAWNNAAAGRLVHSGRADALSDLSLGVYLPTGPTDRLEQVVAVQRLTIELKQEHRKSRQGPAGDVRDCVRGIEALERKRNKLGINVSTVRDHAAGEPMSVDLVIRNPLAVELQLTDMHLYGTISVQATGAAHTTSNAIRGEPVALTLTPLERRKIRLQVVPNSSGKLQIIGIRWSIGGEVHVRRELRLLGPRLNDSRASRAVAARAIDRRLEANVVPSAPWLGIQVTVPGADLPWVAGEIRAGSLVLHNEGSAPITSLLIKLDSTEPIFLSLGQGAAKENREGPLVPAVGLDGTLRNISFATAHEPHKSSLEPGEAMTWPVWVTAGQRVGHAMWRMHVEYTAQSSETVQVPASMATRVVHWQRAINILAGLSASVIGAPRDISAGGYQLAVRLRAGATDLSGGAAPETPKYAVAQVLALSRAVQIHTLTPTRSDMTMQSGQSATVLLRAQVAAEAVNDDFNVNTCVSTANLVTDAATHTRLDVVWDLVKNVMARDIVKTAQVASRGMEEVERKAPEPGPGKSPVPESAMGVLAGVEPLSDAFMLGDRHEMNLVVVWTVGDRTGLTLMPRVAVDAPMTTSRRGLHAPTAAVIGESVSVVSRTIRHSFASGPARVPVTVTIRHSDVRSNATPFACTVRVNAIGSSGAICWSGPIRKSVESLAPGECAQLQFCVLATQQGVFDLNQIRVEIPAHAVCTASAEVDRVQEQYIAHRTSGADGTVCLSFGRPHLVQVVSV